jgi:hypothetical protein
MDWKGEKKVEKLLGVYRGVIPRTTEKILVEIGGLQAGRSGAVHPSYTVERLSMQPLLPIRRKDL